MPSSVRLAFATLAVALVGLITPVGAVRQQPPADRVLPDFDIREGRPPHAGSPQTQSEARRARDTGSSPVRVHPFTGGVLGWTGRRQRTRARLRRPAECRGIAANGLAGGWRLAR